MYTITDEQRQVIMTALGELPGKVGYSAMLIIERGLKFVEPQDTELNEQKGK